MIRTEVDKGEYVPKKEVKYPKLMVSNMGAVVLFIEYGRGTVLREGNGWGSDCTKVGKVSNNFAMSEFRNLEEGEQVILTNTLEVVDD